MSFIDTYSGGRGQLSSDCSRRNAAPATKLYVISYSVRYFNRALSMYGVRYFKGLG